ncbi:MAG: hypothetical protein KC442_14405 [Thermomicrobiales bacterium]|nr:hypothetical protein [Thermomicrobiales bacterium]
MALPLRVFADTRPLRGWLMAGQAQQSHSASDSTHHPKHPWWQVMCLTGVDYFSTLGYQPGIAAIAAGLLSPIATLILILLTLLGALPVYRRVARESPRGEGSIAMLERLLPWWQGKFLVLTLLGFVATDFIVTMTLSAADATAHALENPFWPAAWGQPQILVTLLLIGLLGAVFLRGFTEAVGIAVCLVVVYLALNAVVVATGMARVLTHPSLLGDWREALFVQHGSPVMMVALALIVFPRLALGLSGFETGVAVMPLVAGGPDDPPHHLAGRIRNTRKLLTTAALIMSGFLMTSSVTTTLLIPPEEFEEGGAASGRALAYLAHEFYGDGFGTAYDISTILILWFAGASAMAGLLNIVPRYLPRYGMAPSWASATRPLVLVFTTIAFAVTMIFRADVEAQAGAYATGVLVLITSAGVAVTLAARSARQRLQAVLFALVAVVFAYTTVVNVWERPDGIKIAGFFIGAIVVVSLISRAMRSTELRAEEVTFDEAAQRFLREAIHQGAVRLVANHPDDRTAREYVLKERQEREASHIPAGAPVLFLEVTVRDASEFASRVRVRGQNIAGFHVLQAEGASVPNTIAAVMLAIQEQAHARAHAYFGWVEGNPLKYLGRFIFFGEGDIAPTTREILRQAEPDVERRPVVHVG